MTTLTIVKTDSFVAVDGFGIEPIDCTSLASNVSAIQFDGTNGAVEYNDGTDNLSITAISDYSIITNLWTTAKATIDEEVQADATGLEILKATYGWKRQYDATTRYATTGEQLDQQYHDAVNGTTTWQDAIAVVKSAHPKP